MADDFTGWAISAAQQTKILSRFPQEVPIYSLICVCLSDSQNMYPGLTRIQMIFLLQSPKRWNYRCEHHIKLISWASQVRTNNKKISLLPNTFRGEAAKCSGLREACRSLIPLGGSACQLNFTIFYTWNFQIKGLESTWGKLLLNSHDLVKYKQASPLKNWYFLRLWRF